MQGDVRDGESDKKEVVELTVDIQARPETVWRCVTESDLLSRWLSAAVELEPRVGGSVRIDFQRHGTVVAGVIDVLRQNELLAFTWGVASGPQADTMPPGSTHVVIRLDETASGTRVTLRHEGLPSEKDRHEHARGWQGYLGSLAGSAPLAAITGTPEDLWDEWFRAWGEPDAAKRDEMLARVLAEGGTYRDVHADGAGRAWLSGWMAMCQSMFPGTRVVRDGTVAHSRGSLLVHWNVVAPDGKQLAKGVNHARLDADGRLASVDAFWL